MNEQNTNIQTTATTDNADGKKRKTRTVDYSRTDKRPHSFRYKRGTSFEPRLGMVTLSKETDGTFVIGPAPEGSTADAAVFDMDAAELVSVKKRPNGKTAITFSHPKFGTIACYDARSARASLRAK